MLSLLALLGITGGMLASAAQRFWPNSHGQLGGLLVSVGYNARLGFRGEVEEWRQGYIGR